LPYPQAQQHVATLPDTPANAASFRVGQAVSTTQHAGNDLASPATGAETHGRYDCDILIVGGGAGGTAAALAAATAGATVCWWEETDWLGGQFTSQGVPTPDEHAYIQRFGGTRRYYEFLNRTREHYLNTYRVKRGVDRKRFNPGSSSVSAHSFEPKVGV